MNDSPKRLNGAGRRVDDLRTPVSEAVFERMADYRVMRRLARDPRYRNADNAEQQAAAEEAIEREVCAELDELYRLEA